MFRKIAVTAVAFAAVIGAVGFSTGTANAQAAPPYANAGGPYYGQVYQSLPFNAANSAGVGLSYFWSFGDGSTANGALVAKSYAAAGTYPVTLTVTDLYGRRSVTQTTAVVGQYLSYATYNDCYRVYGNVTTCGLNGTYYAPTYYRVNTYGVAYRTFCTRTYLSANCAFYLP